MSYHHWPVSDEGLILNRQVNFLENHRREVNYYRLQHRSAVGLQAGEKKLASLIGRRCRVAKVPCQLLRCLGVLGGDIRQRLAILMLQKRLCEYKRQKTCTAGLGPSGDASNQKQSFENFGSY
jgi:hypothetical protein